MEQIHDPELPLQKKEHAEFAEKINSFILDKSSKEAARASFERTTFLSGTLAVPPYLKQ